MGPKSIPRPFLMAKTRPEPMWRLKIGVRGPKMGPKPGSEAIFNGKKGVQGSNLYPPTGVDANFQYPKGFLLKNRIDSWRGG